jgi:hypothetical protein
LHHFIASGVWDAAPLGTALLAEADRKVVGDAAWLIIGRYAEERLRPVHFYRDELKRDVERKYRPGE